MTGSPAEVALREAVQHHLAGRLDDAEVGYRQALSHNPGDATIHSDLGNALFLSGRYDEAIDEYRHALKIAPDLLPALCNLGSALKSQEKFELAEQAFRQAIEINDAISEVHSNRGSVLIDQRKYEEAAHSCRRAIDLDPNNGEAFVNLAAALIELAEFNEARTIVLNALKLLPNSADALVNLGIIDFEMMALDTAAESLKAALALEPHSTNANYNLGNVLYAQGKSGEAVAHFERALNSLPGFADAQLGLARIRLDQGDLSGFWLAYAHRWQSKSCLSLHRDFPQPFWRGARLDGKTILVWGEQGIGDEIFFAGLIPEITGRFDRCLVETEPRLVDLFQRSFPGTEVVARTFPADPLTQDKRIDFQVPMGDLPRWLRPSIIDFESLGTYLRADPAAVETCRRRYGALSKGAKIGVSWFSRLPKRAPIAEWAPILNLPDAQFISLQYGDHRSELDSIQRDTGIRIYHDEEIDPLVDMDGFAAQVDAMDAVVTIDNSTLSVAAALGKPTFALVPYTQNWKFFGGETTSLWHPSLLQFRQTKLGDWTDVIDDVAAALREFVSGREPGSDDA